MAETFNDELFEIIKNSQAEALAQEQVKQLVQEHEKQLKKRFQRRVIVTIIFALVLATTLLSFVPISGYVFRIDGNSIVPIASSIVTVFALAFGMLAYLRDSSDPLKLNRELQARLAALESAIPSQSHTFNVDVLKSVITEGDRQAIIAEVTKELRETATTETLSALLEEREADKGEAIFQQRIEDEHDDTVYRLKQANLNLQKRANLNLMFGTVFSVVGAMILGYSLSNAATKESMSDFVQHFIPRFSLVVVIEIFAYFFLNLYKSNLLETRFYNNEITNISNRRISLLSALQHGAATDMSTVVSDLSKTERNNVLTKGQTTYELAMAKIDAESSKNLTGLVEKLLQSLVSQKK